MGPIIILDKSAIQGLSYDEILFLYKHYYVNIAPILVIEILADLKKVTGSQTLSEGQVARLARKLLGGDSAINVNYRTLCWGSLLGRDVPMRGACLISGGRRVRSKDGQSGIIVDRTAEQLAILQWQEGRFTEAEESLAELWRLTIKAINLEVYKERLQKAYLIIPPCRSFTEVRRAVNDVLAYASLQPDLLEWLMDEYDMPHQERVCVHDRWRRSSSVYLQKFAPYAGYCLRVELSFIVAVRDGLISTKPTNRLDLEYYFYLPFCMVFSSADHLHANLAGLFLREDQEFIDAGILKSDLRHLANEWRALSDSEQEDYAYNYGSYPPAKDDSVTARLWQKYMRPWRPGSGNRAVRMSEEEQKRLLEKLKLLMETFDEYDGIDD